MRRALARRLISIAAVTTASFFLVASSLPAEAQGRGGGGGRSSGSFAGHGAGMSRGGSHGRGWSGHHGGAHWSHGRSFHHGGGHWSHGRSFHHGKGAPHSFYPHAHFHKPFPRSYYAPYFRPFGYGKPYWYRPYSPFFFGAGLTFFAPAYPVFPPAPYYSPYPYPYPYSYGYVDPGVRWVPGYWNWQWVPQVVTDEWWVPGHYDATGVWVEGRHETRTIDNGSYQNVWIEGYWARER
jgi:hypothetical protein